MMELARSSGASRNRRLGVGLLCGLTLLALGGCPQPAGTDDVTDPNDTSRSLPNLDSAGNATLDSASALSLDGSAEITFVGEIDSSDDIDVYELGQIDPGDRLYIDIAHTSGNLDPVAAVFDTAEELVAFNDDRDPANDLDPLIDFIYRGDSDTLFLGIVAYASTDSSGEYEVTVRVERDLGVPDPEQQIVYLNWAGGENVLIPNVGLFDELTPFNATDVGLSADVTEELKDLALQVAQDQYAGFNVVFISSDDSARPTVPHSTIWFGGTNPRAFGISEQIDGYNSDQSDDSIIYTSSFVDAFGLQPSVDRMGIALGSTIAHETGHLLGLVHTSDCDDLMGTTCSNVRILFPRTLKTAVVDSLVFPFGVQDSEQILAWVVGLVGF